MDLFQRFFKGAHKKHFIIMNNNINNILNNNPLFVRLTFTFD